MDRGNPLATARGELNEVESIYLSALALLIKENGGSMTMTQTEYDAHRNMDFVIEMGDGKVTITVKAEAKLDG
jgi:hypothetical protein